VPVVSADSEISLIKETLPLSYNSIFRRQFSMNKKCRIQVVMSVVASVLLGLSLLILLSPRAGNVQARSAVANPPMVTGINPISAPNDLNTSVTITGADFVNAPAVRVGNIPLSQVGWVSSTTLTATVPWGLASGVYTLTVINPDTGTGNLPNAFTVTQGINVWTTDGPYGGLIERVVMNPVTPTTLFAAAPGVGVFRTWDSGAHWQKVLNRTDSSNIIFNASGSTVYVDGSDGLFRSTDGGNTWERIWNLFKAFTHPVSDTVVYAVTGDWLGSTLAKSENGGQTWVDWSQGITTTISANGGGMLVFDPTNPQTMYLGTDSGNIFRSVDGGAHWTFASRPVSALWDMAINPFGAHEVWVGPDNRWGDSTSVLVKSANAELTAWTPLGQQWVRYIRFPPVSWGDAYSRTAYLPMVDLMISTNGGATWTQQGSNSFVQDLAFDPTTINRMYTGGNRGVRLSLNGGQTWSPQNDGLAAVTPKRLAVAPQHPETVYALIEGGLIYGSQQAGEAWQPLQVTDDGTSGTSAIAVDPFNQARIFDVRGNSPGQHGQVYLSNNGGLNWSPSGVITLPNQYSGCSIEPQVLRADPVTPGRLLAGVGYWCGDWSSLDGGLYLSTDSGQHWSYLNSTSVISQVNDILYDPQNPARVYAGTGTNAGNGLLLSTDGGATWQATSNLMTGKNVFSLAAEPAAPYRLYAATQYESRHVYRSDNGGATWVEVVSPPSNISEQGLVVMPGQSQILYAATWGPGESAGLYRSMDGAQSWQRAADVLGSVPVFSLAAGADGQHSILYVGTGGGMVSGGSIQHVSGDRSVTAGETLVNAGVYRYSVLWRYVFLPLVQR
jgi:photosystem II stability/assembly factor-like uncharacterized protein